MGDEMDEESFQLAMKLLQEEVNATNTSGVTTSSEKPDHSCGAFSEHDETKLKQVNLVRASCFLFPSFESSNHAYVFPFACTAVWCCRRNWTCSWRWRYRMRSTPRSHLSRSMVVEPLLTWPGMSHAHPLWIVGTHSSVSHRALRWWSYVQTGPF